MRCVLLLLFFLSTRSLVAQDGSTLTTKDDPEFPKGFILYGRLHQGMISNFSKPELYAGGLQLVPQWTVVEHRLRAGVVIGSFYTQNKIQALAGPTVSYKLKTLYVGLFGSAANINLAADHWWGTRGQHLAGGSINLDIGNLLVIGLGAHRDYSRNNWWFQQTLAVRLSKKKKVKEPFNE